MHLLDHMCLRMPVFGCKQRLPHAGAVLHLLLCRTDLLFIVRNSNQITRRDSLAKCVDTTSAESNVLTETGPSSKSHRVHSNTFEMGARLYVTDAENFFPRNDVILKNIDFSTDPFSKRNPSYCFIDLYTEEEAAQVMQDLQGQHIRGRPVRIKSKTGMLFRRGSSPD